jgi:hypothetical protein
MAGQRTRLRFGAVSAEVLLEKTSTKPRGAQHETRRVLVEGDLKRSPDPEAAMRAAGAGMTERVDDPIAGTVTFSRPATTDPFGDPVAAPSANPHEYPAARAVPATGPIGEGLPPGLLGPMGDPTWPTAVEADFEAEGELEGERRDDLAEQAAEAERLAEPRSAPVPEADAAGGPGSRVERQSFTAATYVPPETRVEQGVHLETGEWVDLTDRLDEVDDRTRVDGLEVVRTIPASSYASERVRDAHYLAGVEPESYKVLALLWRALREERMAAEVRWTKRTAQANGIVVARGELGNRANPAHLLLLELEWAANVRKPAPRVFGPVRADVAADEVAAAVELVRSFAAPAPRAELRDERLAKRAELLTLAKAGKLAEYVPPVEPMPADVGGEAELAEALALSSAWVREHAPA